MAENVQTEQELLEEQLQAITGGCNECTNNRNKAKAFIGQSGLYENLAHMSRDPGLKKSYQFKSADMIGQAQNELNQIQQRHPNRFIDLNAPPPTRP